MQDSTETNNTNSVTKYKISGIYKLNGSDCTKYYIRQTGCKFTLKYLYMKYVQALHLAKDLISIC